MAGGSYTGAFRNRDRPLASSCTSKIRFRGTLRVIACGFTNGLVRINGVASYKLYRRNFINFVTVVYNASTSGEGGGGVKLHIRDADKY